MTIFKSVLSYFWFKFVSKNLTIIVILSFFFRIKVNFRCLILYLCRNFFFFVLICFNDVFFYLWVLFLEQNYFNLVNINWDSNPCLSIVLFLKLLRIIIFKWLFITALSNNILRLKLWNLLVAYILRTLQKLIVGFPIFTKIYSFVNWVILFGLKIGKIVCFFFKY